MSSAKFKPLYFYRLAPTVILRHAKIGKAMHFGGCCVCVWAQSPYTRLNNNNRVKTIFHNVSLHVNVSVDEEAYPVIYLLDKLAGVHICTRMVSSKFGIDCSKSSH